MLTDLRYSLRALLRNPGFTLVAVITLALGIGANAAMFGIVDALLLRPPSGVRDPGNLVRVYWANTWRVLGSVVQPGGSYPVYEAIRDEARTLQGAAAEWPRTISVGRGAQAQQLRTALVSHTYFPLLGLTPALGRFFGADEDRAGGAPVAVISADYWRTAYNRDAGVLGRTLRVGSLIYNIVGVVPADFRGTGLEPTQLWLPIAVAGPDLVFPDALTNAGNRWLTVIGRLRPGAAQGQAAADLSGIYRAVGGDSPDTTAHVLLGPIQEARGPRASRDVTLAVLLWGMAAIVLLIAAANVANLLLTRALSRRREIAVRLAIGAGRARLLRQLIIESLVLAALGGAAAVLLALWAAPLVRALLLPRALAATTPIDVRVLAFTGAVALLVGLLTGLVPGLQSTHGNLAADLKTGAREGGPGRSALRTGLLVGQAALTLVLLVGAGLFVRSLRNVLALDLGTETRQLVVVDTDLSAVGYTAGEAAATFQRLLERVQALPGVQHAALSVGGPFGWSFSTGIRIPGLDSIPTLSSGGPYYNAVSADFFPTMGTSILRGRGFTPADRAGAPPVAVVGQAMARLFWPNQDPIGRCIQRADGPACYEIVGVAEDARRNGIIEAPQLQWYLPLAQLDKPPEHRFVWVRAVAHPETLAPLVRRAVLDLNPEAPYVSVQSVQSIVDRQLRPWRLGATVFSLFGGLAVVLAAVGLYGVLAYVVGQQTREIGVRVALGAKSSQVMRLVLASALRVTMAGALLGVATTLVVGRVVASLLYGVRAADSGIIGLAALVLVATAIAASALPARRAMLVDPMEALRYE